MARNAENIRGGFDGRIWVGAKGATMPVNPYAAIDTEMFTELGWLTDDGVVAARGRDVAEEYAMGATNAPVWTRVTSQESTVAVTFKETKAEVLSVFYGQSTADMATTAATGGNPQFATLIEQSTNVPEEYALVIDLSDGDFKYRRCYSRVMVTETGDQTFVTTASTGYPVTFRALIGADGTVAKHMWTELALPATVFPSLPEE
jgi:hypothetical protein